MKSYSLANNIVEVLGLEISSQEFINVYSYSLSYLTKGLTVSQYHPLIKPYLPKTISAKVFRLGLLKNKYNYFTLKLFVLHLPTVKRGDTMSVEEIGINLKINHEDVHRIYELWLRSPLFRRRIKTWFRELPEGSTLVPDRLEAEFVKVVYPAIESAVKRYTWKKLRFLSPTYSYVVKDKDKNKQLEDFHCELQLQCLQAYYSIVPNVRGTGDVIKYLGGSLKNMVTNIINKGTAQKRGRTVCIGKDKNNERQFSLLEVAEHQMKPSFSATGDELSSSWQNQESYSTDPREVIEASISIKTILDKYGKRPMMTKLILIYMGMEDAQFTEWLQNRKLCKPSEDNVDFQEKVDTKVFQETVCKFFNVGDPNKVTSFLIRVGNDITGRDSSSEIQIKRVV